jgi:hypothetical protein
MGPVADVLVQFAQDMAELQVPLAQGRMMNEARSAPRGATVAYSVTDFGATARKVLLRSRSGRARGQR